MRRLTLAVTDAPAAGLTVTPRVMADGRVVLSAEIVEAQPDDAYGVVIVSNPAFDVTVEVNHVWVWSQAYVTQAAGKRQQVAIVIVLRVLPGIQ